MKLSKIETLKKLICFYVPTNMMDIHHLYNFINLKYLYLHLISDNIYVQYFISLPTFSSLHTLILRYSKQIDHFNMEYLLNIHAPLLNSLHIGNIKNIRHIFKKFNILLSHFIYLKKFYLFDCHISKTIQKYIKNKNKRLKLKHIYPKYQYIDITTEKIIINC
jgi:hypothetical protein